MGDLLGRGQGERRRVLFIAGEFSPATAYGGSTVSNLCHCRSLEKAGLSVAVIATNSNGASVLGRQWRGWRRLGELDVYYAPRRLKPDIAPALVREFRRSVAGAAVVHASAAYHWFLPFIARECRRLGKPLIVSPRGALLPEARGRKSLKKRAYERLLGARAFRRVSCFHVTSQEEAEALADLFPDVRLAVIPNGVELPLVLPARDLGAVPYLLYMGRLHPYKRVERIVRAFARATGGAVRGEGIGEREGEATASGGRQMTGDSGPTIESQRPAADHGPWAFVIAGGGEAAYRRELERVAAECGVGERVRFVGHVAGEGRTLLLAQADFVVQAPDSENFGNVVAEALAHGTPALVGKGLPWAALDRERCGFWVDGSEEALADGMLRLMGLPPEERRTMGERGRAWMARDFSWESIATRMMALYEQVIEETKPDRRRRGLCWSGVDSFPWTPYLEQYEQEGGSPRWGVRRRRGMR